MPSLQDMRERAQEAGLMKLDKLIKLRQHIPTTEFPIPVKELCERYEKLYTGCINDVLRENCLLDQNLPSDIMPLRDHMVVCGEAFTVKSAPNVMIEGEMTFRAQMLDEMKPEGVVVWDTSADTEASLFGGNIVPGGHKQDRNILIQLPHVFGKFKSVHTGHHNIRYDQIEHSIIKRIVGIPRIKTSCSLISAVIQKGADGPIQFSVIFHNQNLKHGTASANCCILLYSITRKC